MKRRYHVMGVRFTDQPFTSAIDELTRLLRGPAGHTVFFANAATLNLASRDEAYRSVLNSASSVYGDGTGIRWAARVRGSRLQANLNGTDIVPELIRRNPGARVYLLGGDQDLIVAAARRFRRLFPDARLVGWHNGFFDKGNCEDVLAEINAARPDLLLVGFGNPLQEQWVQAHQSKLDVPLTAAVGGLFAYWAGTLERAPGGWRRWGVEWLYIMLQQPRKLRRYVFGNPLFLIRMLIWARHDSAIVPLHRLTDGAQTMVAMMGSFAFL